MSLLSLLLQNTRHAVLNYSTDVFLFRNRVNRTHPKFKSQDTPSPEIRPCPNHKLNILRRLRIHDRLIVQEPNNFVHDYIFFSVRQA